MHTRVSDGAFGRWATRLVAAAALAAIALTPALAATAATPADGSGRGRAGPEQAGQEAPATGKPEGGRGRALGLGLRARALASVVAKLTARIEAEAMNETAAGNVHAVVDRLTAFAASEGAQDEEEAAQSVGAALEEAVAKAPKDAQKYKLLGAVYKKLGIQGIHVYVRGKRPEFDVAPFIREGRTLVPVRAIVAALGADVKWDAEARTVTVTRGETTVVLKIDSRTATVNGQQIELDVPASITQSRTFVPLRFLSQALGAEVTYDADTQLITVNDK